MTDITPDDVRDELVRQGRDPGEFSLGRFCIQPRHLEPVDEAENQRRRTNRGAAAQRIMRSAALALRDERRTAGEEGVF